MIDDRWWLLEPNDHFLEINDDDIEEMKFNSGIEDEPDQKGKNFAHLMGADFEQAKEVLK